MRRPARHPARRSSPVRPDQGFTVVELRKSGQREDTTGGAEESRPAE